jgi:hypothetical protein
MTTRDFHLERLMERVRELQVKHQGDHGTYMVELAKLLITNARNEKERKDWEVMLKEMKTAQRLSLFGPNQDDEREEVIKQVRATLKASQPFVKFWVVRAGIKKRATMGGSMVQWSARDRDQEDRRSVRAQRFDVPLFSKDGAMTRTTATTQKGVA